jgi:hypothetical protein
MKGMTLNYENSMDVIFTLRDMILENAPPVHASGNMVVSEPET